MSATKNSGFSLVGISSIAIFVLMAANSILAQQPKPKPVTPPPVVPGQKPPGAPAVPQPQPGQTENAQPAAATDRALMTGDDAVVQPFLDDNTLAVLRVDVASVNLQQAKQWFSDAVASAQA